MSTIQPIEMPEVLDPDRLLSPERGDMSAEEHRDRARLLEQALHESCDYGKQVWNDLAALRRYLVDSLPPDPRAPGPKPTHSASPTGPDDEEGWDKWITAYAAITSVLAGPHGDSGFGLGEARQAAQLRRTAPVLSVPTTDSAEAPTGEQADTAVIETRRVVVGPEAGVKRGPRERLLDAGVGAALAFVFAALARPRRTGSSPSEAPRRTASGSRRLSLREWRGGA
jgi:hypothetical protein